MKTRLLIIIGITILTVSITCVSFAYNQEIKLATGLMQSDSEPSDHYPEFRADVDYCREWCDQKELVSMGCDESILSHITKNTNLLSDTFDGNLFSVFVGLPDGVTKEKYQECADFILETRTSVELEESEPEPVPEPKLDTLYENCGPGTTLQYGICVVTSESKPDDTNGKWEAPYQKASQPNLRASCAFDGEITMWFYQFIVNPLCEIDIQIISDYECICDS
jgi:hypothetical protein